MNRYMISVEKVRRRGEVLQTYDDRSLHIDHVIGRQTQLHAFGFEQSRLINSISAALPPDSG